jgi:hypothetical protein
MSGILQHAKRWEHAIIKNLFACHFELDGDVDMNGFVVFAVHWLGVNCIDTNECNKCGFFNDETIDIDDLIIYCQYWIN